MEQRKLLQQKYQARQAAKAEAQQVPHAPLEEADLPDGQGENEVQNSMGENNNNT